MGVDNGVFVGHLVLPNFVPTIGDTSSDHSPPGGRRSALAEGTRDHHRGCSQACSAGCEARRPFVVERLPLRLEGGLRVLHDEIAV